MRLVVCIRGTAAAFMKPIFYLCNNPLRALGVEESYPNFHVLCVDYTEVVEMLEDAGVSIFCLEKARGRKNIIQRNTRKLLLRPEVQSYLLDNSKDRLGLVFFKPRFDPQLVLAKTRLAESRRIISLQPTAKLSSKLENKLKIFRLVKRTKIPTSPSLLQNLNKINFAKARERLGLPLVIQFARGWFGNRTFLVHTPKDLTRLRERFSNRRVKLSSYIDGLTLTNNGVVGKEKVWLSYPFLQLNDFNLRLAGRFGTTIGNEWGALSRQFGDRAEKIAARVYEQGLGIGQLLRKQGYQGYFGLDFLVDQAGQVYFQELNPRFTASVQMVSQLEDEKFGGSLLKLHYAVYGVREWQKLKQLPERYFFKPLKGARVVARNVEDKSLRYSKKLGDGVYRFVERDWAGDADPGNPELRLTRRDYRLSGLGPDELLLFTAGDGRLVSPDQEIAQLQSKTINGTRLRDLAYKIFTHD